MKNTRRNNPAATRLALGLVMVGAVGAVSLVPADEARACGGLFCNAPPANPFTPLPVAQNGENVVFAITKDPAGGAPTLTAHIQIKYTGDAAKFSWVVPVEAVPTLSTGTDRLFSSLASVTQPSFNPSYQITGTCLSQPGGTGTGGSTGTGAAGTTGSAGGPGAGGAGGGGVSVSFQGAVGPFDAAVVSSTDPVALKMWLSDNGYFITDGASALIDAYVREGKYFVALKLLNGVGVSAIQPIVLTFRGTEPCVPLRLTAIAANPDMPVLVWVLSDKRVAPRGFYEITVDEARIDWWSRGSTYFGPSGLVSQAANEAGGNAFITEYAGTSTIARSSVYVNGQINLTTLAMAMTPPAYVQQLTAMGLANDTLMLSLLTTYIPMPDAVKAMNVTAAQFYGNISSYWNQYAFPPYDLAGLTNAISTSIVKPRLDAQMMIDAHPYLTRLNTFISPEEMNQDAFFFETQNLADVSNVHTATIRTLCGNTDYMYCNAPQRLELQDGRMIWLRAGSKSSTCMYNGFDTTQITKLPAAEVAFQRDVVGEGTRVVDNTTKIQSGIATNNARYPTEQMLFPIPTGTAGASGTGGAGGTSSGGGAGGTSSGGGAGGTSSGGGAGGTSSGSGAGGTSSGGGATGTAGTGPAAGTGGIAGVDGVGPRESSGSGCGCSVDRAGSSAVSVACAGALGLVLAARRRRRGVR